MSEKWCPDEVSCVYQDTLLHSGLRSLPDVTGYILLQNKRLCITHVRIWDCLLQYKLEYDFVHYFTQKNMRLCITTPELQEVGILVSGIQDISRRKPGQFNIVVAINISIFSQIKIK